MEEAECDLLAILAEQQARLISNDELITQQVQRQEVLTTDIINWSKELISSLRHLSLIRCQIMQNKPDNLERLLRSQTLQGLRFASYMYCPTFVDPNRMNHFMYFISFLRQSPQILARILYSSAKECPRRANELAYSLLLSLFQQGWCIEEDATLVSVLISMADLQFSEQVDLQFVPVKAIPPRMLLYALSDHEVSCAKLQPFVTFATAYLFNAASFSYFQSSLAPMILKLYGMSRLRDLQNTFDCEISTGQVAPLDYWREICGYALEVYHALVSCLELLPPGVFQLFKHLRELKVNLKLIFFEAFVNKALDNPSFLGLLPWHPSHGGWHPSRDVANVFRTKYVMNLKSKSPAFLGLLLQGFDSYNEIDLDVLINKLCEMTPEMCSFMINEAELLSTNPGFPKELLVTGSDLCTLHCSTLLETENIPELATYAKRLGTELARNEYADEHFSMVMVRRKGDAAGPKVRNISLFSPVHEAGKSRQITKVTDPYLEQFCDLIAGFPPFSVLASELGETSVWGFIKKLRILSPSFLTAQAIKDTETIFWYGSQIGKSERELVDAIARTNEKRDMRALVIADRTASLRSQHLRMKQSLKTISDIKNNVHSHIILQLADIFMDGDMSGFLKEAMGHAHEHMTNLPIFTETVTSMVQTATEVLTTRDVNRAFWPQLIKIFFFRLTEHITFGRYIVSTVNRQQSQKAGQKTLSDWQKSIIVSKIIEEHAKEMIESIMSERKDAWEDKMKYIVRASNILGHIRKSSGLSVIVHTVIEAVSTVQTLCSICHNLTTIDCLVVMLLQTKAKHVLLISKFLHHFLLDTISHTSLQVMFAREEINSMSIFPSAVILLLEKCQVYDQRVCPEWAKMSTDSPPSESD